MSKLNLAHHWKVHTRNLFEEIAENTTEGHAVYQPLRIMMGILRQMASLAIEIDDIRLHAICVRLALYEVSDPHSDQYDPDKVTDIINEANRQILSP